MNANKFDLIQTLNSGTINNLTSSTDNFLTEHNVQTIDYLPSEASTTPLSTNLYKEWSPIY